MCYQLTYLAGWVWKVWTAVSIGVDVESHLPSFGILLVERVKLLLPIISAIYAERLVVEVNLRFLIFGCWTSMNCQHQENGQRVKKNIHFV